jgi:hypothetical protein
MSLKAIKNKVTNKAGRQILVAQKHSPTLLFGVGVVGVVATVVLASRATLKMEELIGEAEEKKEKIEAAKELGSDKYSEEDAKQDGVLVRTQTVLKIAKLYAPAIAVGVVSIGCFTGSHIILNRRNVALTAAYGAVDKAFREYRGRVVDELGKEKDQEFRFGVVQREMGVDTDEGTAVKTVKGADPEFAKKNGGKSMYAVVFDEGNRNWTSRWNENAMFLRSQQMYANDRLNAKGFLFLNDVYEMLGFERTSFGQVVGWVVGHGDGYIDFGILDNGYESIRFVNGDERSVWLDFNVDGMVLELINDQKGPA